jgi:MFS family permease
MHRKICVGWFCKNGAFYQNWAFLFWKFNASCAEQIHQICLAPVKTAAISYKPLFSIPVIVAALGYFVDVFDLLLFNIVRTPSLKEMGLTPDEVLSKGIMILNFQQAGLLVGGILWGVMGDKRGRLSVLFGSIIMYSLANIACGFVQDPTTYAVLRFVAGLGLAGELGAGLTLVSEILPAHLRGYASSIIAGVGLLGSVAAFFVQNFFDWRMAYWVGGGLGLALLLLRISVAESGMFNEVKSKAVSRGNFFAFFTNAERFWKYMRSIGVGLPTYFVIGLLATFATEFSKAIGIVDEVQGGRCIMYVFIGTVVGDLFSGPLSQWLKSRKKAIFIMISMSLVGTVAYLYGGIRSANVFYAVCGYLGFSIGYIAMFLTVTAEQFGTNLRATATTTVANFVRATTLLTLPLFQSLKVTQGVVASAAWVGLLCFGISYLSLWLSEETFGKDLNYVEE